MTQLDVLVPVKNEARNIKDLVSRIDAALRKAKIRYEIIFVNDHSTDSTEKEIKEASEKYPIKLLTKKGKPGKAQAVIEASEAATAEYVAMIDGDLQYPPEALPEMYKLAKTHGMVVANRKKHHTSLFRKVISKINSKIFGKALLGFDCDPQSGLKVFKKEVIEHLDKQSIKPWALDMPLLHTALELGYSITCVEVEFSERNSGQSKVNFFSTSAQIASTALKLKLAKKKVYKLKDGFAYKRKRFTTHTNLPHDESAITTFTRGQKAFLLTILVSFLIGLILNPRITLIGTVGILSFIYFADVVFSLYVLLKSLHFPPELKFDNRELSKLSDKDLPVYSVLVPLYKEGNVLPHFLESIGRLDWPKEKLDVMLLLEEDDKETQEAAKKLDLPYWVRVVVVPDSQPKTKPKACNYGLLYAKGEYIVIYDAEDIPDPLQLKKAYLGFQKLGEKYFCLQSKLNYFNPSHNLLTRLFTAEYSLWFDVILPGLQSIESTIPLGGTSNHFRKQALLDIHAWDPFNVTEDCDLGVRLFKKGFKTAIIDSVTLEEANSNPRNWIRQRSRWIKGYFQTYLVHMRKPLEFFREHGIQALIFQLIIGMRMTFMLINPILWALTISYFALYQYVGEAIESIYPAVVFYTAAFSLVVGNFMYIYNYMIGCAKRGHYSLIKFVFLIPFYWIMASIAATMAAYQLFVKPHYWEKTHHGLHLKKKKEEENVEIEIDSVVVTEKARNFRIVGGSLVLISASMFTNVINFVYSTYLGRSVDLAEFGLLSVFGSIISLTQIPLSTFSRTVTHKSAMLFGKYNVPVKSFWRKLRVRTLLPSLIASLVWIASAPFLLQFFQTDNILPFLLITPVWSIGIISSADSGFLSGSHKFSTIALMMVVEALAKLLLTIAFVNVDNHIWLYAAIPGSYAASFIVGWIAISFIKNETFDVTSSEINNISKRFMGSAFLTKLAGVFFLSMDVVLAKHYLSPTDAGRYALISLVGKMVYFLGTLFTQLVNPLVGRNEGAKKSSWSVFNILIPLTALATTAGFVFFGVFAPITLPILLGDKINSVLPYLMPYTFAFAALAVAGGIVNFHQSRGKHLFAFLSLFFSVFMMLAIIVFHDSLNEISLAVSFSGVLYLVVTLLAHLLFGYKDVYKKDFEKILIFNWRDTKHKWAGGAEVYVHEIAKNWVRQGKVVTVFCGNDGHSKVNETIDGVNIIRKGGHYTVYLWAFLYYIFSLKNKCDVIVESINGVPFFSPLYSNKPVFLLVYHVHQEVFREHLQFPLSTVARFIEKYMMPLIYKGSQVITISQSTKLDLINLGLTESDSVQIVSPGVDVLTGIKSKKTKYPSFAYIGRLKHYKNIDILLKAFAKVLKSAPKARLNIAGTGEESLNLQKLARELNINESVDFLGKVTEEEKAKILAQTWVAIQPSSIEGWGITVIEANAYGTPVIASNVNGLKDSVVDGKTGLLVEAKNESLFARAMHELIRDKDYLVSLSREAKVWAKNFSWSNASLSFLTLIDERMNK